MIALSISFFPVSVSYCADDPPLHILTHTHFMTLMETLGPSIASPHDTQKIVNLWQHPSILPLFMASTDHAQTLHVATTDPHDLLKQDAYHHQWARLLPKDRRFHLSPQAVSETVCEELREQLMHFWSSYTHDCGLSRPCDEVTHALSFDELVQHALRNRASDIHLQPHADHVRIVLRIDGMLRPFLALSYDAWQSLCAQIKIYSHMDVSELRAPQHGRFQRDFAGRTVDCRVSAHPTLHGCNIVIRVLDIKKSLLTLDELGFSSQQTHALRTHAQYQQGLILFTGPTGSGKTTSLYALLNEMDGLSRHIVTLENPIEYVLSHVRQSEVTKNMSFADGVRSLLRQDPDVMLIGEIRDEDTARMAFRASMTGHLVLSTLHTHDIAHIPRRLMDLGMTLENIVANVHMMVSQRLVRRICPHCHGRSDSANTCRSCHGQGFLGRMCIAHCVPITPQMRHAWLASGTLELHSDEHSIDILWREANRLIQENLTTTEEVLRVLGPCPL